ncbi:class I SAM-dependent methyltransferase [Candidatus Pacearchaeota archaeon]|nr:class I SAM-dependent methyltransferase [Candidatus Pacearchaeota archaeon]
MESSEQIQKTASTLINLSEHSNVRYAKAIAKKLLEEKDTKGPMLSIKPFSAFPVSRFITNQRLLEYIISKNKDIQIIELGPGFTPHYLNLKKVSKYIEIDFESNSRLKEKIIKSIKADCRNLFFVSGDILVKKTWLKVKKIINSKKPVLIFSEGVVSQYFDKEQKKLLSSLIKDLLKTEGSIFVLDDTLRNHPDLHSFQIIKEGMSAVIKKSGSQVYGSEKNNQTFGEEISFWKTQFSEYNIQKINYVLSRRDMDFAIKEFKLILIANDSKQAYNKGVEELSYKNKKERVWEEEK